MSPKTQWWVSIMKYWVWVPFTVASDSRHLIWASIVCSEVSGFCHVCRLSHQMKSYPFRCISYLDATCCERAILFKKLICQFLRQSQFSTSFKSLQAYKNRSRNICSTSPYYITCRVRATVSLILAPQNYSSSWPLSILTIKVNIAQTNCQFFYWTKEIRSCR